MSYHHYKPDYLPSSLNASTPNATRKKIQNYSYALNDKIGKGYSSIVYKGRNQDTNQTVAIKVIDMKGVKDQVGKQMLECEIQALKTLNHPNILKCYDVFTTANNCYIITEFCNEGDLASIINKKRRLSESQTLGFLKDIAQGFIEMASKNYLHRDLKLANIFLRNGVAKIADFGFAKKNKNPGQKERYNVGSPLYMSPEALKKNIYSIKNDIWSIGVLIYELLHGETPWQCKTQKQLMIKMINQPVKFTVNVSEQLKQFIRKCLIVDQKHRLGLEQMKTNSLIKRLGGSSNINVLNNKKEEIKTVNENVLGKIDQNVNIQKKSENKENSLPPVSLSSLPKSIIDKNNTILVHHINIFRLLFKIVDQIRVNRPHEKQLIKNIASEVLSKVNYLKNLMSSNLHKLSQPLELKQFEKYINETINPSIKKYKTVIMEYHKKYNSQLKQFQQEDILKKNSDSVENKLKTFLKSHHPTEKQCLLFHWMIQYCKIPQDIRKDYLQSIIQPKIIPLIQNINDRILLV